MICDIRANRSNASQRYFGTTSRYLHDQSLLYIQPHLAYRIREISLPTDIQGHQYTGIPTKTASVVHPPRPAHKYFTSRLNTIQTLAATITMSPRGATPTDDPQGEALPAKSQDIAPNDKAKAICSACTFNNDGVDTPCKWSDFPIESAVWQQCCRVCSKIAHEHTVCTWVQSEDQEKNLEPLEGSD